MFDASHNTLSYGVMGSVTSVPVQYSLETILYLGSGVNQAMTDWGSVLLARCEQCGDHFFREGGGREYLGSVVRWGTLYVRCTPPLSHPLPVPTRHPDQLVYPLRLVSCTTSMFCPNPLLASSCCRMWMRLFLVCVAGPAGTARTGRLLTVI
jgi:hypothetical protein